MGRLLESRRPGPALFVAWACASAIPAGAVYLFPHPAVALLAFLLLFLLTLECSGVWWYFRKDKRFVPVLQKLKLEQNSYIREQNSYLAMLQADRSCSFFDTLFPHPYVGFVHHDNPPCGIETFTGGRHKVNAHGMFGREVPLERSADEFVIFLTGGSVTTQFAQTYVDGPRYLEEELNRRYLPPKGERFTVLNCSVGAWKQPQQLNFLNMYVHAVDGVVTLDGYNEFRIARYRNVPAFMPRGLRFDTPAGVFFGMNIEGKGGFGRHAGIRINRSIYTATRRSRIAASSKGIYLLTHSLRQYVDRKLITRPDNDKTSYYRMFAAPGEWDDNQRFQWGIEQYRKYLKLTSVAARAHGIPASHFIQPIPAIGKTLTPEEKQAAGSLAFADDYQAMTDRLLTLADEGYSIHSLLEVFADTTERVYIDEVHCSAYFESARKNQPSKESLGYRIMARAMAEKIGADWGLALRAEATSGEG